MNLGAISIRCAFFLVADLLLFALTALRFALCAMLLSFQILPLSSNLHNVGRADVILAFDTC